MTNADIVNGFVPETANWTNSTHVTLALNVIAKMKGSQKALAAEIGISPQYLSDVLNFKREPTDIIAEYMGLRRVTIYVTKDEC